MCVQFGQLFAAWLTPLATCGATLPRRHAGLAIAFRPLFLLRISLLASGLEVASEPRKSATGEIDRLDGQLLGLGHERGGVAERVPAHLAHRLARVGRPCA